jgi:hypothetical protein
MLGSPRSIACVLVLSGASASACDAPETAQVPAPDYDAFERDVYPILLRDCGFPACHGSEERPFRVYGPGRLRLDPELDLDAEATIDEVWLSYQRTRSMLVADGDVEGSPLLRKVLPGGGHQGVDALGRSVYADASDPSYVTLLQWARGELWYGDR